MTELFRRGRRSARRRRLTRFGAQVALAVAMLGANAAFAEQRVHAQTFEPLAELLEDGRAQGVFPGAVLLIAQCGQAETLFAVGDAVDYDGLRREVTGDTVFDIASLTKLFTAVAVMQLVERGEVALDAPVGTYLESVGGVHQGVTVRRLLAHTSGLTAWRPWYELQQTGPDAVLAAALATPLAAEPGSKRIYSDLGYIVLGRLVEQVSGLPLDVYIERFIAVPADLTNTRYNPPEAWRERTAATEVQASTGRGLVWGSVHDENAWAMGGVAGHAGLFSTAKDLATFLSGLYCADAGILAPATLAKMVAEKPLLGWQQPTSLLGPFVARGAVGHTGFTGTSLFFDFESGARVVLLTNHVHPTRTGPSMAAWRRSLADALFALTQQAEAAR